MTQAATQQPAQNPAGTHVPHGPGGVRVPQDGAFPEGMREKRFRTGGGDIVYWISRDAGPDRPWLAFLPGLTADRRLFDGQVEHFAGKANVLVWDPPSHGESRPFSLIWSLDDLARWLHEILQAEGIARPVLVGQSMGGYVSQAYLRLFPNDAAAFVSIDSAPLDAEYFSGWELAALRHTKLMYLSIPWGALKRLGTNGTAMTDRGRAVMAAMMDGYGKREYCELAAHGFRVLADAVSPERSYALPCPAMLVCGTKDSAGSARRYNREWTRRAGLPLHWIEGAGHNSNTDAPEEVNRLIEEFVGSLTPGQTA